VEDQQIQKKSFFQYKTSRKKEMENYRKAIKINFQFNHKLTTIFYNNISVSKYSAFVTETDSKTT